MHNAGNRKVNMKNKEIEDRSINPLIRIANTLEEILRLVKLDQKKTEERYRKYDNEDDMLDDLSKPWKETK
jgi:molybdenum cofactor biosynthesis enzyme MoaA